MNLSIITVNYNNSEGLQKTMQSVFQQSFCEYDYIVIDGGSTDGSRELIERNQKRLSYWCSERDKGIYDAMNKGLAQAKGDYCLFLNSGDYFCDKDVLNDVFDGKTYDEDLIIGRQKYYDKRGRQSIAWSIRPESIDERFFWSNTLPHQSTFIKTELLRSAEGYDLTYKTCADWAFWYVAIVEKKCSFRVIDIPISLMEQGGVSQNMEICRTEMAQFLMEHHPQLTMEDWKDISRQYTEALCYRRATASPLSRLLTKIAVRLNKK